MGGFHEIWQSYCCADAWLWVLCTFVLSRVVGVDDGNACCHQNQSVKRKKELNQVQSCALTPGQRQAGSLQGRTAGEWNTIKQLKLTGVNVTGNRAENITRAHTHTHIWTLAENSPRVGPASKLQAERGVCGYCLYSARWLLEHYCTSCLWHPAPLSTIHTAWPRNMESAASRLYGGSAFLSLLGFELGPWLEDKNHLKWSWVAT